MSKPKAPPPPDYAALAQQQGQVNKDTAQFNTELNRVNQNTPYGSVTWERNPSADPNSPDAWTQNVTLDPAQQQLLDQQDQISGGLGNLAVSGIDRVAESFGKAPDFSNLPGLSTVSGGGTTAQAGLPFASVDSGAGNLATKGPAAGNFSSSQLDINALLQGMGGTPGVSTSFDTSGVRKLPGEIDDTSRRRVEEALMSRVNPQYQQDEDRLRTRLLNSGIEVGTEAYNREMGNHSQRLNDARMQAVLAGGQEETRQVGLMSGLQRQEFEQALAKGNFAQAGEIASGNFAMQGSRDKLSAVLGGMNYNLAANNQNFGQDLTSRQFQNASEGQRFSQDLASKQFGNTAADTVTGRQLQIDQLANSMGLANAGFNNSVRQQGMQEEAWMRNLPLNELNALRSGAQVSQPQFQNYYTGASAQAAPILDAGIAQGNANAAAAAAAQSGQNALLGGLAGLGSAGIAKYSDIRLKERIERIGTHPTGVGRYRWVWKGTDTTDVGVLAQELQSIRPDAVTVHASGFLQVDYAAIGGA